MPLSLVFRLREELPHESKTREAMCIYGINMPADHTRRFVMPDGIPALAADVAGVALYGVDIAVLDLFDDACVVCNAVLPLVFFVPVEEDYHTRRRLDTRLRPLISAFKP